ncbi:MAG: hypothetical protein EOP08_14680, partial [Proteobacteria bacterium]
MVRAAGRRSLQDRRLLGVLVQDARFRRDPRRGRARAGHAGHPEEAAGGPVKRVGVVGARGYVGSELLPMIERHPGLELAWVTSTSQVGESVQSAPSLRYVAADPALFETSPVDVVMLALPNGQSEA